MQDSVAGSVVDRPRSLPLPRLPARVAALLAAVLIAGCAQRARPTVDIPENPHYAKPVGVYGFSIGNPIRCAQLSGIAPASERAYLDRLRGPSGEVVQYRRLGSCCHFPTPNGVLQQTGLLDVYEVRYQGLPQPARLYLNMYDPGELEAPSGFELLP